MRILYYYWGELISTSAKEALQKINVDVTVVSPQRESFDYDIKFMAAFSDALKSDNGQLYYDAIFSFNYFPDLSRVAMECGVKYISWVYDSPHLTLESQTINNGCNTIYVFDYALYQKYSMLGIKTINYMPLPSRIVDNCKKEYKHTITFIGNLYDGEQDQYGAIKYLPEYIAGYLEALIKAQQHIYGADLFETLVDNEMYKLISKYVELQMGDDYRECGAEIFRDILRRRVTMNERIETLTMLGEAFGNDNIELYCGRKHPELPVMNKGFAEYSKEMVDIFATSKINLNITLRSIKTGIPLRVMDILGAGGFCMTNYQAELEEYFDNGVDLVWYEDIDDMLEKCRFYIEHDDEREKIARNGHIKVKKLFEFSNVMEKVLDIGSYI